jgi:outer membrane protein assembly factor BamB
LTGHDLADGKLLWECAGFNPENEGNWRTIASPAIGKDIAVVPYGRGAFLAGIRLGGSGDVTDTNRLWESQENSSDVPTAVVDGDATIQLTDRGDIARVDMKTGRQVWKDSLPRNRNKYYASPVLAGNKLYCAREDGMVYVCEIGDDGFKLVGTNDMGEKVIATPAPVRNSVLIRGETHLFRIAADGEKVARSEGSGQ